jgi:hormone-sensitive lipase
LDFLTPEFLIQDFFLGNENKSFLEKNEYIKEFRKALRRNYDFNFQSIYGKEFVYKLIKEKINKFKIYNRVDYGNRIEEEIFEETSQISNSIPIIEENDIEILSPTKKVKFFEISIFSHIKINLKALARKNKPLKGANRILIHFHGGGFVSMSSKSHQVYLKKYCNRLKAIIFSVDYTLAPEAKYPDLIEYCIKAYLYITSLIQKVLKLKDYKIVLMGDSAGGNISMAILNWLIMNQLPLPKSVFLCYPVCYMNEKEFSPSLVHTLKDYIFSPLKFQLCFDCYLDPEADTKNDFMLR